MVKDELAYLLSRQGVANSLWQNDPDHTLRYTQGVSEVKKICVRNKWDVDLIGMLESLHGRHLYDAVKLLYGIIEKVSQFHSGDDGATAFFLKELTALSSTLWETTPVDVFPMAYRLYLVSQIHDRPNEVSAWTYRLSSLKSMLETLHPVSDPRHVVAGVLRAVTLIYIRYCVKRLTPTENNFPLLTTLGAMSTNITR